MRALLTNPEDTKRAEHMLESIEERLRTVRAVNYCANRTINALLMVKLDDDALKDIRTDIILRDCTDLPLDDYELCSLFSNLFDNAVKGCLEVPEMKSRFIELKSGKRDDFFILSCVNSCADAPKQPKTGHGYGVPIINQITQKYHGSFDLTIEDGVAKAIVAIELNH